MQNIINYIENPIWVASSRQEKLAILCLKPARLLLAYFNIRHLSKLRSRASACARARARPFLSIGKGRARAQAQAEAGGL